MSDLADSDIAMANTAEAVFAMANDPTLTPKRGSGAEPPSSKWFKYYAGFSYQFAHAVLSRFCGQRSHILDPWNGAGTTTLAARVLGHRCTGMDVSPVMVIAAAAKTANLEEVLSHRQLVHQVFDRACEQTTGEKCSNEALHEWINPRAAQFVRDVVTGVQERFPAREGFYLSPAASYYMVALFSALRERVQQSKSSNPTWIRPARQSRLLIHSIRRDYLRILAAMDMDLAMFENPGHPRSAVTLGNSKSIPVPDRSVDLVLGSPPYLTRIDYAMATSLELAVLGLGTQSKMFRILREEMTGTSLARVRGVVVPKECWGSKVNSMLDWIREHPSADSSSYYYKIAWQYFDDAYDSLREIARVLKPSMHAVLVLQSSYYKDIKIPLAELYADMATALGLRMVSKVEHRVARAMASINTRSQVYNSNKMYSETSLYLVRERD